jgi:hypothetical protein
LSSSAHRVQAERLVKKLQRTVLAMFTGQP